MKSISFLAVLALVVALAAAGCGSSDSSSGGGYGSSGQSSSTTTASSAEGTTGAAIVTAASIPEVGRVIVDAKGFTLYDFHKDRGTTSACYGACAKVWPPLTTDGAPQSGEGALASKLGTTKRKDGTIQVTYAGWPLYTYTGDAKPGQANGQDIDSFGAEWYALQPSGSEAEG